MISVWYGMSNSGTTGSPKRCTSTFSESSLPIGTDGSIIFGISIILFRSSASTCFSSSERAVIRSPSSATSAFTASASSFLPCAISAPICLEILFLLARRSSTSPLISRFLLSSSMTSSTIGSFASWNLFRMFCLTTSGFSLTNLMSNMICSSLYKIENYIGYIKLKLYCILDKRSRLHCLKAAFLLYFYAWHNHSTGGSHEIFKTFHRCR